MARKNKAQTSADDILKLMYPDLLTSDDFAPKVSAASEQVAATGADARAIADLQAKIAGLQDQLQQTSRTNSALMTQAKVDMPPARPTVDFSKAPNPIDDPAGYAQFMYNANQQQIDYEKQAYAYQNKQAQTSQQKTAMLWSDFEKKFPDYASNDKRVEVAASRVIARAAALGQDTDKYMYGNSAGFMQDIVAEIDDLFGKPVAGDADDGDDDDDGDDLRTDVFGGSVATGGVRQKSAAPEKYGVLSKDIMAWQEKTGFHR